MEDLSGSTVTVQGIGAPVPAVGGAQAGHRASSPSDCNARGADHSAPLADSATSDSKLRGTRMEVCETRVEGTLKNPRPEKSPEFNAKRMKVGKSTNYDDLFKNTAAVLKYLTVKRTEGNFDKVSPFIIERSISTCAGSAVKDIQKTSSGLLVETVNDNQGKKLLELKKIGTIDVEVSAHGTLNTCKGVVVCSDLLNCSEEEIVQELASQGVIACRRLTMRRDGHIIPSASHVLTFKRCTLPEKIKAGIHRLTVRMFIPQPMQCFQCLRFGHPASRCARMKVCHCGKPFHSDDPCLDPIKCINCSGQHSSRSRDCPIYKQEAAIQQVKARQKISYTEAKKLVSPENKGNITYVEAVTKNSNLPSLVVKELMPAITRCIEKYFNEIHKNKINTENVTSNTQSEIVNGKESSRPPPNEAESNPVAAPAAIPSKEVSTTGYRSRSPRSPKNTEDNFLKQKMKSMTNDQDTTTGSETSSMVSAENNDYQSIDLCKTPRKKRKKKGWPKGKPRK